MRFWECRREEAFLEHWVWAFRGIGGGKCRAIIDLVKD